MSAVPITRKWGEVHAVHTVGPYKIVEHTKVRPANAREDWKPTVSYGILIDDVDMGHSYGSLDHALVACVVMRNEMRPRETDRTDRDGMSRALNERLSGYVMAALR